MNNETELSERIGVDTAPAPAQTNGAQIYHGRIADLLDDVTVGAQPVATAEETLDELFAGQIVPPAQRQRQRHRLHRRPEAANRPPPRHRSPANSVNRRLLWPRRLHHRQASANPLNCPAQRQRSPARSVSRHRPHLPRRLSCQRQTPASRPLWTPPRRRLHLPCCLLRRPMNHPHCLPPRRRYWRPAWLVLSLRLRLHLPRNWPHRRQRTAPPPCFQPGCRPGTSRSVRHRRRQPVRR
jgi:hypothetical protein